MLYKDELKNAMTYIGKKPLSKFIGQQTVYPGNVTSGTLVNVPSDKLLEVPVFEEVQMGMSLGYALTGGTVVSIFPRWDFLISATNQLVNHADKWKLLTNKEVNLIIRVCKGSTTPLNPGLQHQGDYFDEFQSMCKNINFVKLTKPAQIYNSYAEATDQGGVHLILEYPDLYETTDE